jgi:site-specific DNA-methyltransferase (adenine-specific)
LTNEGQGVLDPMCGSGTTIAVAARLGRHAIGFDASKSAVAIARARLDRMLVTMGFPPMNEPSP